MRLWSLHPQYLDAKGLVALWREGLLAQKVLAGKTRGYKHHPQLHRFRKTKNPLASVGAYLSSVADEANRRQYSFDSSKILLPSKKIRLLVTRGQLHYEFEHLLKKIKIREPASFLKWVDKKRVKPHPIFRVVSGKIESWEKTL